MRGDYEFYNVYFKQFCSIPIAILMKIVYNIFGYNFLHMDVPYRKK